MIIAWIHKEEQKSNQKKNRIKTTSTRRGATKKKFHHRRVKPLIYAHAHSAACVGVMNNFYLAFRLPLFFSLIPSRGSGKMKMSPWESVRLFSFELWCTQKWTLTLNILKPFSCELKWPTDDTLRMGPTEQQIVCCLPLNERTTAKKQILKLKILCWFEVRERERVPQRCGGCIFVSVNRWCMLCLYSRW